MKPLWWIGYALAALLAGVPAAAQEVQVPLDQSGRVEVVDAALARRLNLFRDEYPGFREARLFQGADAVFVLDVLMRRDGQTLRERRTLSAAEVAELRARISEQVAIHAPGAGLDQNGRYALLGQTALLGLTFYGRAVPYALNVRDPAVYAGTYLLTAAGSFFVPLVLTQNQPVSYGMANLSRYGAGRGVLHGMLLHELVRSEPDGVSCMEFCTYTPRDEERTRALLTLATSVTEGVGGYLWARNARMNAGTAATVAGGSDLGTLWGAGTAVLLTGDEASARFVAGAALAGAAAGTWGGRQLAARRDYSWGDATLMYTASALGVYGGIMAAVLSEAESARFVAGTVLAGSAAGAMVADRLVRDTDFSVEQALLVQLGTLAGGIAGGGVAVILDADEKPFALLSTAGAMAGFGATYNLLKPAAAAGATDPRLRVQLSPHGLLALARGAATREADGDVPLPLFSVTYRLAQ